MNICIWTGCINGISLIVGTCGEWRMGMIRIPTLQVQAQGVWKVRGRFKWFITPHSPHRLIIELCQLFTKIEKVLVPYLPLITDRRSVCPGQASLLAVVDSWTWGNVGPWGSDRWDAADPSASYHPFNTFEVQGAQQQVLTTKTIQNLDGTTCTLGKSRQSDQRCPEYASFGMESLLLTSWSMPTVSGSTCLQKSVSICLRVSDSFCSQGSKWSRVPSRDLIWFDLEYLTIGSVSSWTSRKAERKPCTTNSVSGGRRLVEWQMAEPEYRRIPVQECKEHQRFFRTIAWYYESQRASDMVISCFCMFLFSQFPTWGFGGARAAAK